MGSLRHAEASRNFVKSITLVAALWAAPLSAQVVDLTPNQVLVLATNALNEERPDIAAAALDAFLAQIPDNPTALLLRTEAAILQEDFPDAVRFGQRAFWQADTDGQRFNAARLTALGHARQLQDSRAQLWLRAARQYAPTTAASEAVAQDFQALRQRNPLSVSVRVGITPSDNINGGTYNEQIDLGGLFGSDNPILFDLSEDAVAQSGWEVSGNANFRYRLQADRTSATFLDAGVSGSTFLLTDRSKQAFEDLRASEQETLQRELETANRQNEFLQTGIALQLVDPDLTADERAALEAQLATLQDSFLSEDEIARQVSDVREVTGSSLSFARFNVGAVHIFALAPDIGVTEAGLSYSRTLRKDTDERHAVTASLSHRYSLSDTSGLTVSGVSERQKYVVGGDEIQSYRLQATYSQAVANVGSFSFGYGIEQSSADRSQDEFDSVSYSLSFSPAAPVLGADLGMSLIYREIDWDFFDNLNQARSDEVLTARLTATLRDIEVFGFNPILSITRDERDSTAVRYQTNSTTFSVDIVSSF